MTINQDKLLKQFACAADYGVVADIPLALHYTCGFSPDLLNRILHDDITDASLLVQVGRLGELASYTYKATSLRAVILNLFSYLPESFTEQEFNTACVHTRVDFI